ncbi:SDR family NAD(P)-dependent oxidoreductase [Pseudomonas sp. NPDC090203]|uniref:SDR family NAD(P)-dependent oxidoreductase n=1 Tax=Pseudomonas sp. NPDC090203 TaxID=3364477 RepID=UPI00380C0769
MATANLSLDGDLALITGAGQGNGATLAHGFAKAGAHVLVVDINAESAAQTASAINEQGGNAHSFGLDVTDEAACRQLAAEIQDTIGDVSIVVNNAGLLFRGPFESESTPEKWRKTLDVNVTGMLNVTHAFIGHLKQTAGSVLNIGSICAYAAGFELSTYCTSKGAVLQFTRALASELAADGIRVNGLAPGSFPTAMSAVTREDEHRRQKFLDHVPMGRIGDPNELVGPALFLSSSLASYITGAMLPVDGGYLTR